MTDAQREASRQNGGKSHGPTTAEGKARSSQNSLKHGLSGKGILLASEDPELFFDLSNAYHGKFLPLDRFEADFVNEMVVARWRLQRDWSYEAALVEIEVDNQTEKVNKDYKDIGHAYRYAIAFKALSDNSRSLQLTMRYETS